MIISHKYKFIFIKTYKTGGTSVEIALSKYCAKQDIITSISPKDEALRAESGGRGPQNYCDGPVLPLLKDLLTEPQYLRKNIRRLKSRETYYNHINAAKIRDRVGWDIWNSYYKFCFERNPWDKVVSDYYWRKKTYGLDMGFQEYLAGRSLPLNYKLYSIGGRVAVDKVARFENLQQELEEICKHLGVPYDGILPEAKSKARPEMAAYRESYSEDQRAHIARIFKKEIDLFGYAF